MLKIVTVAPGSIAEQLELVAGDRLLAINGCEINDLIDYQLYARGEQLVVDVEKQDGELWELELERDEDDPLGLDFDHPSPRQCRNNCQFCFVRQLPQGLRKSLYVRDDDYRFSYLYGAYITLTNLSEQDFDRIISQQLSPLYVSVHATDLEVRNRLLGVEGTAVLPLLQRLVNAGISLHTQIVLCPGHNDAQILERTIADLASLHPGILTLALVPVGLTGHRQHLPVLRPFEPNEAQHVVERVEALQAKYVKQLGTRFVFAADEFYLQAQCPVPPLANYEDLAQIENGVGLIALFRLDVEQVLAEAEHYQGVEATVVTGQSAAKEVEAFIARFNQATGSRLRVQVIRNHFFAGHVTVAGLVTGRDIISQLAGKPCGQALIIPDVMCREGDEVLLDDVSLEQIAEQLNVGVAKVPATPWGILEFVEVLADELAEQEG